MCVMFVLQREREYVCHVCVRERERERERGRAGQRTRLFKADAHT